MRALAVLALISCTPSGTAPVSTPRSTPAAAAEPPRPPLAATPEAAVASYFRAGDERASRLVRAAFHPSTPIQWVDPDGTARALTQIEWWPRIDANGGPAHSRTQRTLDRSGDLALIEAVSLWDDRGFHDLLLAARSPEGWQLVGKVFARLPPGQRSAEVPAASPDDERAIRDVLAVKIEAHAAYDPELLRASHLADCRYVLAGDGTLTTSSLSEAAARYAARRDAGITDRDSPWRVLSVMVRGSIAAAILDVQWQGRRHVDHLLLLKVAGAWKIAAAAWGPA